MTCVGRGRSGGAGIVVGVTQVGFGAVSFIDHQIDGHFAFQTADVTVAKVVAQFVHLSNKQTKQKRHQSEIDSTKLRQTETCQRPLYLCNLSKTRLSTSRQRPS